MSAGPAAAAADGSNELPLFPLNTVLFPDGLLELRIFEVRYLDLISRCMRQKLPFGVVCLRSGGEAVRSPEGVSLHEVGTLAELLEVDSAEANVLDVRCRGTRRFELGATRQQADGLWLGDATGLADDAVVVPSAGSSGIVASLAEAIKALAGRGERPFLEPHHFDSAGWVANRWCEILPLPKDSKQRLMAIRDPQARLDAVDALMRSRHVSH